MIELLVDEELEHRIRVAVQEMIPKLVPEPSAKAGAPASTLSKVVALRSSDRRRPPLVLTVAAALLVAIAVAGLLIINHRDPGGQQSESSVDASPTVTDATGRSIQVPIAPTFMPTDLHLTDVTTVVGGSTSATPQQLMLAHRNEDGTLTGFVTVTIGAKDLIWRTNPLPADDGATYTFTPTVLTDGPAEFAVSEPTSALETVLQYERNATAVTISVVDPPAGFDIAATLEAIAASIDLTQAPVAVSDGLLPLGYEVLSRSTAAPYGPRTVLVYTSIYNSGRSLTIDLWSDPTADAQYSMNTGTTRISPVRGHDGVYNDQLNRPIDGLNVFSLSWFENPDLLVRVNAVGMTRDELVAVTEGLTPHDPGQNNQLPPLSLGSYLGDERYTAEQKLLISDGNVTRDELIAAADAYNACLTAAIGAGVQLNWDSAGHYTVSSSRPPGIAKEPFRASMDTCEIANFQAAALVYAYNEQLNSQELEHVDDVAARCLAAAGIDPNAELDDRQLSIEADCYEQAASG